MAQARKDNKGRALRKGETQRKYDLMYIYTYTDPFTHKRKYVYSKDLMELREKEKELLKDQVLSELWVLLEKADVKISAFSFILFILIFRYLW